MHKYSERFLFIYKPIIICTIGLIVIYSLLNSLLIIQGKLFEINDKYTDYFIPAGVSILGVLLFLGPKIKLLDFGDKGKRITTLLLIILIAAPIISSQQYLKEAEGKLTVVTNPSEINGLPLSRYYKISNYYIDLKNYYFINTLTTIHSDYYVGTYFIAPILPMNKNINSNIWYCIRFGDNVSNRLIDDKELQKDSIKSIYRNNKTQYLRQNNLDKISYFTRLTKSDDYDSYMEVIKNHTSNRNAILLEAKYGKFDERAISLLIWSVSLFIFSNISIFLIFLLFPFNENKYLSELKKNLELENLKRGIIGNNR